MTRSAAVQATTSCSVAPARTRATVARAPIPASPSRSPGAARGISRKRLHCKGGRPGAKAPSRPLLLGSRARECQTWVLESHSMEAATWTAIGLLAATSLGSLFYLGSRIDALSSRIDALGARLDARIDAMSADLGARIEAQGAKMDEHLRRHAG